MVVLNDHSEAVNYPIILVSDENKYIPLLAIHNKTNIFQTWNTTANPDLQIKK